MRRERLMRTTVLVIALWSAVMVVMVALQQDRQPLAVAAHTAGIAPEGWAMEGRSSVTTPWPDVAPAPRPVEAARRDAVVASALPCSMNN